MATGLLSKLDGKISAFEVNRKTLLWMICLALLANAAGMLLPFLASNDPYWYAAISKSMAVNNDWVDLFYNGEGWLDKPHFPFWLTALSFKIFGYNAAAYLLPGFIFHIIGAYFTYKLAKLFFGRDTALIGTLLYVTTLHLMVSAFDLRAEAYMLGEIMPACYYWLLYDQKGGWKPLLLGTAFTGCALMTKGPFVVVTIFSGLVILWIYQRRVITMLRLKWLVAYVLCFAATLPELVCLYLQFDAQPQSAVFGQPGVTGVSGVSWFLWDSQFGRFINAGPVSRASGDPFYFVHTLLWSFLPWSLILIMAAYFCVRHFRSLSNTERTAAVYLHASIWPTFLLFSLSKFQLDHYTNILLPFAAIICADYLSRICNTSAPVTRRLAAIQCWTSITIAFLAVIVAILFFRNSWWLAMAIVPCSLLLIYFFGRNKFALPIRLMFFPASAIVALFLVYLTLNYNFGIDNNAGYNIGKALAHQPKKTVYVLNNFCIMNSLTLHTDYVVRNVETVPAQYPYYMVINNLAFPALKEHTYQLLGEFRDIPRDRLFQSLGSQDPLTLGGSLNKLVRVEGLRHTK